MVTRRSFLIGIYQEHFEELGFMYERRLQWLDDSDLSFADIGELEERMEAHLDGLVLGEDLASEVCLEGMSGEDFGTLYSATSVFCRRERWELIERTLKYLGEYVESVDESEFEDVLRARKAMADALSFHAPGSWEQTIIDALEKASPAVAPVLARCAGYRRFKDAGKILCEVASRQGGDAEDVLWALGRVHHPDAVEVLRYHALWGGPRTATAATISGLRMGDRYMLEVLKDRAHGENWPAIPLAIGGGAEELPVLLELAKPHRVTSEALIALGILGDMRAAPRLLEGLSSEKTAEAAAVGLYLLTGKAVVEEREVLEESETDDEENEGTEFADLSDVTSESSIGNTSQRLSLQSKLWMEQICRLGNAMARPFETNLVSKSDNLARINCLDESYVPFGARSILLDRIAIESPALSGHDLERRVLSKGI